MNLELTGRSYLVTGASGGIGVEIVKFLLNRGAKVYAVDRKNNCDKNPNLVYLNVDLISSEQVENCALGLRELKFDGIVHCAGVMRRGDFLSTNDGDYDLVMGVNLKAVWLVQKFFDGHFAGGAKVLFISSRHGFNPKVDPAIYSLSKAAVWSFAEIVKKTRKDLEVKIAFPGSVETDMAWLDVPEDQWNDKRKRMVSAEFIAGKLMDLMFSEKFNYLNYIEENNSYEFLEEI